MRSTSPESAERVRRAQERALRAARAVTLTMTAALAPTGQPAGARVSMALDSTGIPTLAHVDFASSTLRVTRCGTVTCQ